jgi:hypothetical protein
MTKKNESGKSKLIKGSLLYLWEDIKTLNRVKLRALYKIMTGYLIMRFRDQKKLTHHRNLDLSPDGR